LGKKRLKCSWCGNAITPGQEIYVHVPEKKAGKDDRIYDRILCLEQYIWTKNECLEAVAKHGLNKQ